MKTNRRNKKTNRKNKTTKKKIYRKKISNRKLRMSKNRTRGGNNGSMNTVIMDKQIMIDARKAAMSIVKELTVDEKIGSGWQKEQEMNTNMKSLDLNNILQVNEKDYDPLVFWGKLFTKDELDQIAEMLKSEVCGEVNKLAPSFEINSLKNIPEPVEELSTGVKVYNINNSMYYARTTEDLTKMIANDVDLPEKSRILCATLIIIGILTSRLSTTNNNYNILAKGGVAVSFALSKLTNGKVHVPINDLDFKLITMDSKQNVETNERYVLARQICYLVSWLLKTIVSKGYSISTLVPSAKSQQSGYSEIVKISIKRADGKFIPILDMDFGNNVKDVGYFNSNFRIQEKVPNDMGIEVDYIYPSVRQMLAEKLYYYTLYFIMKADLTDDKLIQMLRYNPDSKIKTPNGDITYDKASNIITINHDGEILDVSSCNRFLDKFKKSIRLLVDGIKESSEITKQFIIQYENTNSKKSVFINTLDRFLLIQFMNEFVKPKQLKMMPNMINEIISSIYAREPGTIV